MTWRTLYFTFAASAALALVLGIAAATADLQGTGGGLASSGTVALRVNGPATHACDFGDVLPGTLTGAATCTFSVSYAGSLTAFVALTIQVTATAGAGGRPLFDGSNTSGLALQVSDGHASYTVPTGPGTTGGACPARSTCWTQPDDLAAWYRGRTPELVFSSGDVTTFTITPMFPPSAGAAYQGGSADVVLTAQAVQTAANPLPGRCTSTAIGQPCPPSGPFTWS
jgi:hypothetical protein